MKFLNKILTAGIAVLALASCSHVAPYTGKNFVAFEKQNYTVNESVASFTIGVVAYPQDGNPNTTLSFKVVEESAKSGVDYTVSPSNGVLTFAGDSLQYITVTVKPHTGVFTGDKSFKISFESATNDYDFSSVFRTVNITIKDEDHPLIDLFGTYEMTGRMYDSDKTYKNSTWDMNVSVYEGDVTRVWLDITAPIFSSKMYGSYFKSNPTVYAKVSDDRKTITIPCPQETAADPNDLFSGVTEKNFTLYKWDNDKNVFLTSDETIVFTLQEDGSYASTDNYGFSTPSEVGGLFYYWMNCWGASFKKK